MSQVAKYQFAALHRCTGQKNNTATISRAAPIQQTTSYLFDNTDHAGLLFGLPDFDNIYSQTVISTIAVCRDHIASLDGERIAQKRIVPQENLSMVAISLPSFTSFSSNK